MVEAGWCGLLWSKDAMFGWNSGLRLRLDLVETILSRSVAYLSGTCSLSSVKWTVSVLGAMLKELVDE